MRLSNLLKYYEACPGCIDFKEKKWYTDFTFGTKKGDRFRREVYIKRGDYMQSAMKYYDDVDSWKTVMFLYNSALKEVGTKLEILNDEFQHVHRYNPIEHIKTRIKSAESIVKKLKRRTVCDAAATLPNDIILARSNLPIKAAFETANTHVASAVKEICAMLAKRGIVNIDLPSFKKVFFKKGEHTFFGIGSGSGANASEKALSELAASPLIEFGNSASCAESLMVSLVCGEDFEMNKMQALLENVAGTFGVSERICFGAIIDKSMNGGVKICAMGLYDASRALPKKSEAPVKQISVALNSASAPTLAGEDRRSKINPLEEGSCQAHGSSDENRP